MAKKKKENRQEEDKEITELLSPTRSIDLKIMKELEEMPQHFTTLLLLEPTSYSRVNVQLIKYLLKKAKSPGIYITLNKSFSHLNEVMKNEKMDSGKIFFIDAITRGTGRTETKSENCVYIESPNDLVGISVEVDNAVKKLGKNSVGFLVFDSVSTLLIYNNREAVEKFIHSIIGRVRETRTKGVFLMVKSDQHSGIKDALSQFCDKTFEIK